MARSGTGRKEQKRGLKGVGDVFALLFFLRLTLHLPLSSGPCGRLLLNEGHGVLNPSFHRLPLPASVHRRSLKRGGGGEKEGGEGGKGGDGPAGERLAARAGRQRRGSLRGKRRDLGAEGLRPRDRYPLSGEHGNGGRLTGARTAPHARGTTLLPADLRPQPPNASSLSLCCPPFLSPSRLPPSRSARSVSPRDRNGWR